MTIGYNRETETGEINARAVVEELEYRLQGSEVMLPELKDMILRHISELKDLQAKCRSALIEGSKKPIDLT